MRAVSFGARLSISLSSGIRMTASVYLGEIYKSFVRLSTEAKRNWTFAIFQRTNSRHTAVSLIQFSYDLVFLTMRGEVQPNSTKLLASNSPANILMLLLRLTRNRATNLFKWAMMKFII